MDADNASGTAVSDAVKGIHLAAAPGEKNAYGSDDFVVKCLFNHLRLNRRVATRHENHAANNYAKIRIAPIRLWS